MPETTLPKIDVIGTATFEGTIAGPVETTAVSLGAHGLTSTNAAHAVRFRNSEPGTATVGTDVTPVAGTVYVSELFIPVNATLTGLGFLIGSVGGTDKAIVALYDSTGAVVAKSALAGTTVGTAATVQRIAFTAAYVAKGPGLFHASVSVDGTTARLRALPFGTVATTSVAGTFGTLAAITPPTAFAADKGPYVSTY